MEITNRIDEYLKRIELNRPINGANEEYLNRLHLAHLTHIPFETFDLIDLKELNISLDYIFDRLIHQHRGGVCYQMNGLFAFILQNFHYNIQLIPCAVYSHKKKHYADRFTHVALCVTLDNGEKVLCDVGFSREFLTPLVFRPDVIQYATNGFFRLTKTEDNDLYYKLERGFLNKNEKISLPSSSSSFPQTQILDINPQAIQWMISYRFPINFSERCTKLEDFEDTCSYVLHSPEVILNHCTMCHLHTYQPFIGAYGIIGREYCEWIIENGIENRTHILLSDDDEQLKKLLKEKFHLIIERKLSLVNIDD